MKKILSIATVLTLAIPPSPVLAKPGSEAAAKNSNSINHVVKRGETLSSLAEKYYGSSYEKVRLQEYNPWIVDPDKLNIGDIIHVPEPKSSGRGSQGNVSLNPGSGNRRTLLGWIPSFNEVSFLGFGMYQILIILTVWFFIHFSLQGTFVWLAAHLAFVRDVSFKKSLKVTFQSESLAFLCISLVVLAGLTLLYVHTTSPGNPPGPEILSAAEDYINCPSGIILSGLVLVAIYGFLGIRFIPPAFGIPMSQGIAVVMLSILIPHLVGFYLIGHRMGIIN